MTTLTNNAVQGDVVKYLLDPAYNVESYAFRNVSGATITDVELLGTVVKVSSGVVVPVLATDEANAQGVIISDEKIESLANNTTTTKKYAVLMRGPAIISQDELPTDDLAGDALTMATLVTALVARGIVVRATDADTWTDEQTT